MAKKVAQPPVFTPRCSTEQLLALRDGLEVLGGKWKMLILMYLFNKKEEPNHFKKIQREIAGISAKMLTKELRDLEMNLLVIRTLKENPVMALYELSDYGETAIFITQNIMNWGLMHRQKIKEQF